MPVLLSFFLFSYKQTKQKYGTRNTACRLLDHRQQQLGITTGSYLFTKRNGHGETPWKKQNSMKRTIQRELQHFYIHPFLLHLP